jgi:hypothetical protein
VLVTAAYAAKIASMLFKVVHPVNGKSSKQHSDIGYVFFFPSARASET